jgi:hypothetical protein
MYNRFCLIEIVLDNIHGFLSVHEKLWNCVLVGEVKNAHGPLFGITLKEFF